MSNNDYIPSSRILFMRLLEYLSKLQFTVVISIFLVGNYISVYINYNI